MLVSLQVNTASALLFSDHKPDKSAVPAAPDRPWQLQRTSRLHHVRALLLGKHGAKSRILGLGHRLAAEIVKIHSLLHATQTQKYPIVACTGGLGRGE